jgi:hypothetical protein
MSRTRVMLIGALPVGSVNRRAPMYPAGGQGPSWQTNFITSATTVNQVPQNLMRVTNNNAPSFRQSSVGERAVPLEAHMLGRLGSLGAPMGTFAERKAQYDEMVANSDPDYVAYSQTLISVLTFGQRLMGGSVGAYHGYKRSRGKMSHAIGWGIAGTLLPVITVGVGLFQGLAQPKK